MLSGNQHWNLVACQTSHLLPKFMHELILERCLLWKENCSENADGLTSTYICSAHSNCSEAHMEDSSSAEQQQEGEEDQKALHIVHNGCNSVPKQKDFFVLLITSGICSCSSFLRQHAPFWEVTLHRTKSLRWPQYVCDFSFHQPQRNLHHIHEKYLQNQVNWPTTNIMKRTWAKSWEVTICITRLLTGKKTWDNQKSESREHKLGQMTWNPD